MPQLNPVGHVLPLRSPYLGRTGQNRVPNLLLHHQNNHPPESYLRPEVHQMSNGLPATGYNFFGRFVKVIESITPNFNAYGSYMRLSEVAALALEQTFGKAGTLEDVFTVPWGLPENRNQGNVFWDTTNDRIIAKAREGFILAIEGTNLVEAGVYLPRVYREAKSRQIPEGIAMIELKIEGHECWSFSVSPLHIKCSAPNLATVHYLELALIVKAALDKSLSNRSNRPAF